MSPPATPNLGSNPVHERKTDDTRSYSPLHALTVAQARAVDALLAGESHEQAAAAAGVHRITVTRWANHHPAFVAAVNQGKVDRSNKLRARADELTLQALEVVEAAVRKGDTRAALTWLKLQQIPTALPVLPVLPEDVIEQVRCSLPTALEIALSGDERSTPEAEREIRSVLALPDGRRKRER